MDFITIRSAWTLLYISIINREIIVGYIYKITNKLNNKVYIGQTIKTVQKRFTQHKNNSNKSYFSQIVLYKAFNKYGVDNFECETLEEIPNEQLDEREKYWINYYDSYNNGYNSTLGGKAIQLYEWDTEDIIKKYYELKSARKVALEIGCDHSTIDRILNENNVKRFTKAQQYQLFNSRPVRIITKNNEIFEFLSTTEAATWLVKNNYAKTSNIVSVRRGLCNRIKTNKKYLGMFVEYIKE